VPFLQERFGNRAVFNRHPSSTVNVSFVSKVGPEILAPPTRMTSHHSALISASIKKGTGDTDYGNITV
jgi:hypothetical protein